MSEYFHDEIELADIQRVESVVNSRLNHYIENYPKAFREIEDMEATLEVLSDLYAELGE